MPAGVIDLRDKITVPEAARLAQRHPETIKRWLREYKLSGEKIGQVWYIETASLTSVIRGLPERGGCR